MRRRELEPAYGAGVAASLIAETAFISTVAVVSLLQGMDPWMVARMPASFLYGPEAVEPSGFVAGDLVLGLLMHLWLGILVGLIYAALLPRLRISPIAGGMIAGAVLYVLGFWILPLLFPSWLAPFWLPPLEKLLEAVTHAVYGWVFGVAYQRLSGLPHSATPSTTSVPG